jgi:hypothetical protein
MTREAANEAIHLEPFDLEDDDLSEETTPRATPSGVELTREGVIQRLHAYSILPPHAARLSDAVLDGVEQVFVTCAELVDDDSRRRALPLLFNGERALREVLLAIVPLFYDELFFDERTPTRDLVELTLIAHAKWRRTLRLTG